MAKTLDLRTYLLLERAFVRRLQRSWRIQSAPTYAKITQHCLDHQWDKARQLVPELDMAEVGTENREWITYMLLSCAVFGAGTVAKGKPSFVGVGTFDTFLKQVTNNLLMYLEYRATAQVQAEALQSIAEDEAKTKALPKVAWDEAKHPRDKEGQFTEAGAGFTDQEKALIAGDYPIEGGGGPIRAEWIRRNKASMDTFEVYITAREAHHPHVERLAAETKKRLHELGLTGQTSDEAVAVATSIWSTDEAYLESKRTVERAKQIHDETEASLKAIEPAMRKEIVMNLATDVAKKMGVDPSIIHVVYKDPSEFVVGNKHFREGGHFNPGTGQIEINSRNISYGEAQGVKGLATHEVSHFIYHQLTDAAEAERERFHKLSDHYQDELSPWFHERFTLPQGRFGKRVMRPEWKERLEREFPAEAVMAHLSGGEMFSGIDEATKVEDGHSKYAEAYWSKEAVQARGTYDTAINETTAEISRYLLVPQSWHEEKTPDVDSPWTQFTMAMHEWYRWQRA